jgi:heme/copper-type cytochrome/quinol oxidase subunit 2
MWTLLKREIQDNAIYFFLAALLTTALVISLLSIAFNLKDDEIEEMAREGIVIFIPILIIVALGFVAMGVNQMKLDKTAKISFFLRESLPYLF